MQIREEKRWISSKVLFSAVMEQLAENRQALFTVTGMSMWPFLCHGRDQVIVEKADRERLRKGDIVLFRVTDEHYILHRITHLKKDCFQTTGDGNLYRDGYISYQQVIARVKTIYRKNRKIDCDSLGWKWISFLWMALFPVRGLIRKLVRFYFRKKVLK